MKPQALIEEQETQRREANDRTITTGVYKGYTIHKTSQRSWFVTSPEGTYVDWARDEDDAKRLIDRRWEASAPNRLPPSNKIDTTVLPDEGEGATLQDHGCELCGKPAHCMVSTILYCEDHAPASRLQFRPEDYIFD